MVTCFGLRQSKKGLDKENRKKQNETCRWWSDLFRCSPEQIFTVRVSSVYSCFLGLNWIEGRENQGFPGGIVVKKNPPASPRAAGSIPMSGRPLQKDMATHFSILAWEILWTEELGGLLSMGLQKGWTQLNN